MAMDAKWYASWVRLIPASTADEKMRNLEAADMLEELDKRVPRWISVEERLPMYNQALGDVVQVLVADVDGDMATAMYLNNEFAPERPVYEVAYWMPLPKGPKEE